MLGFENDGGVKSEGRSAPANCGQDNPSGSTSVDHTSDGHTSVDHNSVDHTSFNVILKLMSYFS